jgi:flagellar hook assembly protein FlgD
MIPNKYYLYPNYPNPFNPITSFVYDLPKHSQVKVSIYNTLGREIKTLVNREQNNGSYIIQWDGNDTYGNRVSSGVYLYHLNANSFNQTRRMILLK